MLINPDCKRDIILFIALTDIEGEFFFPEDFQDLIAKYDKGTVLEHLECMGQESLFNQFNSYIDGTVSLEGLSIAGHQLATQYNDENIKNIEEKLLGELYKEYLKTGRREFYCTPDEEELKQYILAARELKKRGYLEQFQVGSTTLPLRILPAGIDYFENPQNDLSPSTFNIDTINFNGPSIVGNQQNATINIGSDLDKIRELLKTVQAEDRQLAEGLIQDLETWQKDPSKFDQGKLAKAKKWLSKYSDICVTVLSLVKKIIF